MADAAAGGVGLILVAAGRGARLGAGMPKALVPVGPGPAARPLVVHALERALCTRDLEHVVVVAPPDEGGLGHLHASLADVDLVSSRHGDTSGGRIGGVGPTSQPCPTSGTGPTAPDPPTGPAVTIVPGGAERSDSVAAGLAALPPGLGIVLVHDAARAFTPTEVFDRVVHTVRSGHAAVIPALPVTDTIKQVTDDGAVEVVTATPDRAGLRAVQTPQGFLRETLERAHAQASAELRHTDDAGMVEALGGHVAVIPGDPRAMKVTTPQDLQVASGWVDATDHEAPLQPTLVVLSGFPGVGKTSLARSLCRRLGAAHLRVESVEQAVLRARGASTKPGPEGYAAAYALAADQLAVGLDVVVDAVNGIPEIRSAWEEVATRAGARLVPVLVECSDAAAHRARVEERVADIAGHRLPTWDEVSDRELDPWDGAVRIDTADVSASAAARRIAEACR